MNGAIHLLLLSLEAVAISWAMVLVALACLTWQHMWEAYQPCDCRKGAWNPECPRHGRGSAKPW